ncbi:hypothetical protein VTK73DRAFT_10050 [Phialemonium thermophilum]|uniref:Uncharacterized protein n=1 Tax=Phialemonium thermophilum TaxID=223376 RepID=A0ABR3VZ09_9PEZI
MSFPRHFPYLPLYQCLPLRASRAVDTPRIPCSRLLVALFLSFGRDRRIHRHYWETPARTDAKKRGKRCPENRRTGRVTPGTGKVGSSSRVLYPSCLPCRAVVVHSCSLGCIYFSVLAAKLWRQNILLPYFSRAAGTLFAATSTFYRPEALSRSEGMRDSSFPARKGILPRTVYKAVVTHKEPSDSIPLSTAVQGCTFASLPCLPVYPVFPRPKSAHYPGLLTHVREELPSERLICEKKTKKK